MNVFRSFISNINKLTITLSDKGNMTSNKKFMIPYQSFDLSTDLSRCSLKEKVYLEPRDSRMVLHQIK